MPDRSYHGTTDEVRGDAQAIVDVAQAAAGATLISGEADLQSIVIPDDHVLAVVDPAAQQNRPRRAQGFATLHTAPDFIRYVDRHKQADLLTLWVDRDKTRVVAVFNDHPAAVDDSPPEWGDHGAILALRPSREWEAWLALDGKMISQEDFAEHVEAHQAEVREPDAADLLDLAQSISATTTATFRSAKRLSDGRTSAIYDEEMTTRGGASGQEIEIPKVLKLGLRPFHGGEYLGVDARLRTRINAGKLTIGYILDRPDDVQDAALAAIAQELEEKYPSTYLGVREAQPKPALVQTFAA